MDASMTIKVSKDTYIPTDRDIKEGMEPIIPITTMRSDVELELTEPIEIAGSEVTHVTVHPPTTRMVKDMQKNPNVSQAIELFVVACLRDYSPDDTDLFLPRDYNRIQSIVLNFI